MTFDIVIPTKNRLEKLKTCLYSLDMSIDNFSDKVYIYFDSLDELNQCPLNFNWLEKRTLANYNVSSFWSNHARNMTADVLVALNDDIIVDKDCFKNLKKNFIDLDRVVGLNQYNISNALDSAFFAIGKEFIKRFPNNIFYCPDYRRFYGDKELGLFAKSINKFYFDKEAKIFHTHASFYPEAKDSTHCNVRTYLAADRNIYNQRKEKNYLWGRDFNLIRKGINEIQSFNPK